MGLVHLQSCHAQHVLRRHRVTERAFGSTREPPDLLTLSARRGGILDDQLAIESLRREQLGIGLIVIPDVGVAVPVLRSVLVVVPRHLAMLQETRFQPLETRRLPRLHLHRKGLHEDRPVGEAPADVGVLRPVRIDDVIELDLGIARQRDEPILLGPIRPERCVHRIRDQSRCGDVIFGRGEQTRLAQLARERFGRDLRRGLHDAMESASCEVNEVDLTRAVLGKLDDADLRVGQLTMLGHFAARVFERPELARVVVTVDVGPLQFGKPIRLTDVSARDRPEVAVRMLDDRGHELARSLRTFGPEWVFALVDAPAIVAPLLDEIDHLPQVLSDLTCPQPLLVVEAELPNLTMPERPDLTARIGLRHERVVLWNRIWPRAVGMIDVDAQDRAEQIGKVLSRLQSVRDAAAVAGRQIEEAVRAESDAATVVSAGRPFEDDLLAGWIGHRRLLTRLHLEAGQPAPRRLVRFDDISDVEESVLLELRMERHAIRCLLDVE